MEMSIFTLAKKGGKYPANQDFEYGNSHESLTRFS